MKSSTYVDWRQAYIAGARDARKVAKLMILEAETRVPIPQTAFQELLVQSFDDHLTLGLSPALAALQAMDTAVRIASTDPTFTFLLPMFSVPYEDAVTHVTARYLSRFSTVGDLDSSAAAPPRLTMKFSEVFVSPKFMIWFSPDECPDLPDDVAKDLGLPHFERHIAYRACLELDGVPQFVPSCFDAGLYEAWQEPPPSHIGPCGLTRHVETGQRIHNEFVVKTSQVSEQNVVFERLPAAGPTTRVGPLQPDFTVNR